MAGTCLLAALCLAVRILSHITTFHLIKSIPLIMLVSSCGHSESMFKKLSLLSRSGKSLLALRNDKWGFKILHKQGTPQLFLAITVPIVIMEDLRRLDIILNTINTFC